MRVSKEYFGCIAIFFFSLFVAFLPWDEMRSIISVDRDNYYNYFLYGINRISYVELVNILDFIKNEWFWHYSIGFLVDKTSLNLHLIFNLIGFFCFFVFSLFVYKKCNIFYIFLLINPLIIDLIYSQLRISLALAFFILFILIIKKFKIIGWFFILLSLLTHTAMVPFILTYTLCGYVSYLKIGDFFKIIISTLIGFILSLVLGPLKNCILFFIGDRRSNYNDELLSSSILYLSFWVLLLFLLYFQSIQGFLKGKFNNKNILFSISILSLILLNIIIGGYSTRMLAISMPFLIVLIYNFNANFKILTIFLYILYTFTYFYIWW